MPAIGDLLGDLYSAVLQRSQATFIGRDKARIVCLNSAVQKLFYLVLNGCQFLSLCGGLFFKAGAALLPHLTEHVAGQLHGLLRGRKFMEHRFEGTL